MQQEALGANVLVYAYQYFPETTFTAVTEIDDSEDILVETLDEGETLDAVPNPEEFDGFIIRYEFSAVPYHGIMYVPQDVNIDEGSQFSISKNSNFISAEQNLIQTRLVEPPS